MDKQSCCSLFPATRASEDLQDTGLLHDECLPEVPGEAIALLTKKIERCPQELRNHLKGNKSQRSSFYFSTLLNSRETGGEPLHQDHQEAVSPQQPGRQEALQHEVTAVPEQVGEAGRVEAECYYEVDKALNEAVNSRLEMHSAQERLAQVEVGLAEARRKCRFLQDTRQSNRILAEVFQASAFDEYRRLLARKRAIQETLAHLRSRSESAQSRAQRLISKLMS